MFIKNFKILFRKVLLKFWYQLIIFTAISILLTWLQFYSKVLIDKNQILDILKVLLELNAILLGFLVAFFFFIFQSNEERKLTWFLEFRKNFDELISISMNLPDDEQYLLEHLEPAIEILDNLKIHDFAFSTKDRKEIETIKEKILSMKSMASRIILFALSKITLCTNMLVEHSIGFVIGGIFLDSIKKISSQIIIGVIFIVTWKLFYPVFNPLALFSFTCLLGMLTIGSFGELITHLTDYYRYTLDIEESASKELIG